MSWVTDYFEYTQHIPISILNIIVSLIILRVAYHRRDDIRGGRIFLVVLILLILRALLTIPTFANSDLSNLLFWQNVQWPVNPILVTLWFLFALRYSGIIREVRLWMVGCLAVVPTLLIVLMSFDHQWKLIRLDYQILFQQGLPTLDVTEGVLYGPLTLYIYSLAIIGVLLILRYSFASPNGNRRQALTIFVAVLLFIFVYTIHFRASVPPALLAQIIIFIAQTIIAAGILRRGFLQFRGESRPLLMLAMHDAFILFDHYGTITDINEKASMILGQRVDDLRGQSITSALEPFPELFPLLDTTDDMQAREVLYRGSYYHVTLFQIQERGAVSRCLILRDKTPEKDAELERLKRIENQARLDAMTNFIQMASHDLKHPLTNIGVSLYLLEKLVTDERPLRHVQAIHKQSDKLQRILDDMFLLMRLEGQYSIEVAPLSVTELMQALDARYQPKCDDKTLTIHYGGDPYYIQGDYDLILTGLSHLMDNALNHTSSGDRITMNVEQTNDHTIAITIQDTGTGIPADVLEKIGDPFFRADVARNSSEGGVGLGLTLVYRIVDLSGGTVTISSEVNVGTTVAVSLPQTTKRPLFNLINESST